MARRYVSFAMQTLAKCCKMLPVMVWGFVLGKRRYTFVEVAIAGAVVAGCASFIFSGSILSSMVEDTNGYDHYVVGTVLLLLYLLFDGFASTWQDKLFVGYHMGTSNQVLYTTLCSTFLSFGVLLFSFEMRQALAFLGRNPAAWGYVVSVSCVATIIQYFVRCDTRSANSSGYYPPSERRNVSQYQSRCCALTASRGRQGGRPTCGES